MCNRRYACCVLALLLCLRTLPALAQDNPWRVQQYQAGGWANSGYPPQSNGGGWSSNQQRNDSSAGGYAENNYSRNGYPGGQATGTYGRPEWPAPESQNYPPRSWDGDNGARARSDADYYASLQQPGRQPQTRGYGPQNNGPANTWRQNPGYGGSVTDYSSSYGGNGYSVPSTQPPSYLYGRQYGEFPPLEGEERKPSAERLQVPAPSPRPAAPQAYGYGSSNNNSSGYGQGYGSSNNGSSVYGQGYGNGAYPDPALAGPSTLGNPGVGLAPGPYGSPYGTGVPGPYGW